MRFDRHPTSLEETVFAGGYPRILDRGLNPSEWLRSYVATYIERDVRTVSNVGDLTTFQRFVELCAGRTGQLINLSSLASDCGVSQPTARAWLSILEAGFIVFSPASVSRESGQTAGENAEAAFLRYWPGLLAHRYPYAGPTPLTPPTRSDIRDVGRVGGREASDELGGNTGTVLLSKSGRRRGGPFDRTSLAFNTSRSEVIPNPVFEPFWRSATGTPASDGFFHFLRRGRGLWRRRASRTDRRPIDTLGPSPRSDYLKVLPTPASARGIDAPIPGVGQFETNRLRITLSRAH